MWNQNPARKSAYARNNCNETGSSNNPGKNRKISPRVAVIIKRSILDSPLGFIFALYNEGTSGSFKMKGVSKKLTGFGGNHNSSYVVTPFIDSQHLRRKRLQSATRWNIQHHVQGYGVPTLWEALVLLALQHRLTQT